MVQSAYDIKNVPQLKSKFSFKINPNANQFSSRFEVDASVLPNLQASSFRQRQIKASELKNKNFMISQRLKNVKSSVPSSKDLKSESLKTQKIKQRLSQYNVFNASLNNDLKSSLPRINSQESINFQREQLLNNL